MTYICTNGLNTYSFVTIVIIHILFIFTIRYIFQINARHTVPSKIKQVSQIYTRNEDKNTQNLLNYILTWNLPALVRYLTPLNGLYFSPYMSSLFTLSPLTASWLMENWRL